MKCLKCIWLKKKSTVTDDWHPSCCLVIHSTCSYYDEDGKHHDHTSPCDQSYTKYTCSNGHQWNKTSRSACWCGWESGKDEIIWDHDTDYYQNMWKDNGNGSFSLDLGTKLDSVGYTVTVKGDICLNDTDEEK